jgi:hypothetical protein
MLLCLFFTRINVHELVEVVERIRMLHICYNTAYCVVWWCVDGFDDIINEPVIPPRRRVLRLQAHPDHQMQGTRNCPLTQKFLIIGWNSSETEYSALLIPKLRPQDALRPLKDLMQEFGPFKTLDELKKDIEGRSGVYH